MKNVCEYETISSFITEKIKDEKNLKKNFSLQQLSRRVGLRSKSFLAMVANGKRLPSRTLLAKLSRALGFSDQETSYLNALLELEKCTDAEERFSLRQKLKTLADTEFHNKLEGERLKHFSNWHFSAIGELIHLSDFSDNPKWIAKKLKNKITPETAKAALEQLVTLGFLEIDSRGRYVRSEKHLATNISIPNRVARDYHLSVLNYAKESVANLPTDKRFVANATFSVSAGAMKHASERIYEFIKELSKTLHCEPGEDVYQLSVQYFPLTEEKS